MHSSHSNLYFIIRKGEPPPTFHANTPVLSQMKWSGTKPHPTFIVGSLRPDHVITKKSCLSFPSGSSEKPSSWVYRELKRSLDMTKASPGEFSVCFTKLQQDFFNNRPRKLKDLILLVKYWHQQVNFKLYLSGCHLSFFSRSFTSGKVQHSNVYSSMRFYIFLSNTQIKIGHISCTPAGCLKPTPH